MKTLKVKLDSKMYKELQKRHKEVQKEFPHYKFDDFIQRALSDFIRMVNIPKFIEYMKEQKAKEEKQEKDKQDSKNIPLLRGM